MVTGARSHTNFLREEEEEAEEEEVISARVFKGGSKLRSLLEPQLCHPGQAKIFLHTGPFSDNCHQEDPH